MVIINWRDDFNVLDNFNASSIKTAIQSEAQLLLLGLI